METISLKDFQNCIDAIIKISDPILDGWILHKKGDLENGIYLTKKQTTHLPSPGNPNINILVTFEYHIAYNISYGVPVVCFNIWKQDGTLLSLEEYWQSNENLKDSSIYDTLTQMDHPVLRQPFLTLHPCRTQEILRPFLEKSKNPVISWLSVVGPFVHLNLLEEYLKNC